MEKLLEVTDGYEKWRDARDAGWHHDIGYAIQDTIRSHRYELDKKGRKPTDPGWHVCSCGNWEGYWPGFEPHVADHIRDLVTKRGAL